MSTFTEKVSSKNNSDGCDKLNGFLLDSFVDALMNNSSHSLISL